MPTGELTWAQCETSGFALRSRSGSGTQAGAEIRVFGTRQNLTQDPNRSFLAAFADLCIWSYAARAAGVARTTTRKVKRCGHKFSASSKQRVTLADPTRVVVVQNDIRFEGLLLFGGVIQNSDGQVSGITE